MTTSVRPPLMHARTTLSGIVARWDRRLRLAQTLHWLPVALLIGTLAAIALALAARLRPLLGRDALIPAAIALIALSAVILLALIWLPRRTFTRSARHFDLLLDLDERLSTAAELLEGRISAPAALFDAQITDAQDAARGARVRDRLPLRHHWRAWLALTFALIALAVLIALPNPQDSVIAALAAEQAAVEDARAALREITEAVAAEPGLSDQERADLLQILETNRAALELPNITPEEAFAAVSEVRSALQGTSARIQQRLAETAQALQAASDALSGGGMPGTNGAALQQALEALRDQAQALSSDPAASAALAQRLEAAADALTAASPAAAQALREAASAVRSGDPGAAQAALDRAGAALQQASAQSDQRAGTSSALDQAARAA
ncbi:MAG: hypothetical protein NZM00_05695, partial [Anaerolinea sp.]|nr:hypothetical protein [Anaerolinea sp.]